MVIHLLWGTLFLKYKGSYIFSCMQSHLPCFRNQAWYYKDMLFAKLNNWHWHCAKDKREYLVCIKLSIYFVNGCSRSYCEWFIHLFNFFICNLAFLSAPPTYAILGCMSHYGSKDLSQLPFLCGFKLTVNVKCVNQKKNILIQFRFFL